VEKFPFEVYEHGWGEFEIKITVSFQDPLEKTVDLFHQLKLYPQGVQPTDVQVSRKPVVVEYPPLQSPIQSRWLPTRYYDEIVFNQPREELYNLLVENDPPPPPQRLWRLSEYCTR
jgi:YEATS domain-containing protein 4